MDTYRYADLINAAGDGTADSLIADLQEGVAIAFSDGECFHGPKPCTACIADTSAAVLRELLNAERV